MKFQLLDILRAIPAKLGARPAKGGTASAEFRVLLKSARSGGEPPAPQKAITQPAIQPPVTTPAVSHLARHSTAQSENQDNFELKVKLPDVQDVRPSELSQAAQGTSKGTAILKPKADDAQHDGVNKYQQTVAKPESSNREISRLPQASGERPQPVVIVVSKQRFVPTNEGIARESVPRNAHTATAPSQSRRVQDPDAASSARTLELVIASSPATPVIVSRGNDVSDRVVRVERAPVKTADTIRGAEARVRPLAQASVPEKQKDSAPSSTSLETQTQRTSSGESIAKAKLETRHETFRSSGQSASSERGTKGNTEDGSDVQAASVRKESAAKAPEMSVNRNTQSAKVQLAGAAKSDPTIRRPERAIGGRPIHTNHPQTSSATQVTSSISNPLRLTQTKKGQGVTEEVRHAPPDLPANARTSHEQNDATRVQTAPREEKFAKNETLERLPEVSSGKGSTTVTTRTDGHSEVVRSTPVAVVSAHGRGLVATSEVRSGKPLPILRMPLGKLNDEVPNRGELVANSVLPSMEKDVRAVDREQRSTEWTPRVVPQRAIRSFIGSTTPKTEDVPKYDSAQTSVAPPQSNQAQFAGVRSARQAADPKREYVSHSHGKPASNVVNEQARTEAIPLVSAHKQPGNSAKLAEVKEERTVSYALGTKERRAEVQSQPVTHMRTPKGYARVELREQPTEVHALKSEPSVRTVIKNPAPPTQDSPPAPSMKPAREERSVGEHRLPRTIHQPKTEQFKSTDQTRETNSVTTTTARKARVTQNVLTEVTQETRRVSPVQATRIHETGTAGYFEPAEPRHMATVLPEQHLVKAHTDQTDRRLLVTVKQREAQSARPEERTTRDLSEAPRKVEYSPDAPIQRAIEEQGVPDRASSRQRAETKDRGYESRDRIRATRGEQLQASPTSERTSTQTVSDAAPRATSQGPREYERGVGAPVRMSEVESRKPERPAQLSYRVPSGSHQALTPVPQTNVVAARPATEERVTRLRDWQFEQSKVADEPKVSPAQLRQVSELVSVDPSALAESATAKVAWNALPSERVALLDSKFEESSGAKLKVKAPVTTVMSEMLPKVEVTRLSPVLPVAHNLARTTHFTQHDETSREIRDSERSIPLRSASVGEPRETQRSAQQETASQRGTESVQRESATTERSGVRTQEAVAEHGTKPLIEATRFAVEPRMASSQQAAVSESLKAALKLALEQSRKRLVEPDELRLTLPFGELGTLDIDVLREREVFSIRITADPAVAAVMEEQRLQLAYWLRDQGFPIQELEIGERPNGSLQHSGEEASRSREESAHSETDGHRMTSSFAGHDSDTEAASARPMLSGARVWTA